MALVADAESAARRRLREALEVAALDVIEVGTLGELDSALFRPGLELVVCDPNLTDYNCERLMTHLGTRLAGGA